VAMLDAHPNLGDVVIATAISDYEDVSGVKMPKRLTTTIDKYPQFDLRVAKSAVDVDVSSLAAPDAVKSAAAATPPAQVVTVEPVAKGIWRLAGSGNHRSIVFEFADHLLLFEVPLNETRSKAVIDEARKLSSKPLTHAVVSHHHFDHSGGLRVAVAEGLTIITHKDNEAFFKDLVARPWTLQPDQLATSPKPLMLQLVDDTLTLKDAAMEVQLYHLIDNAREGTNLFAYVPRGRLLVQADLYDNTWERHLWGQNVLDSVRFALWALNEEYAPVHAASGKHTRTIKPDNTIVIASSISNGGAESLQALEQDDEGLIDGLMVTEPNAQPRDMTGVPGLPHHRTKEIHEYQGGDKGAEAECN